MLNRSALIIGIVLACTSIAANADTDENPAALSSGFDWKRPNIESPHVNEPFFARPFMQVFGPARHKDADFKYSDGGKGNSDDDGYTATQGLIYTVTSFDRKRQLSISAHADLFTERYTTYLDDGVVEALFDYEGTGDEFQADIRAGRIEGVDPDDYETYLGRRGGRRLDRIAIEANLREYKRADVIVSLGGGLDLLGDFGFVHPQNQFHYIIDGRHIGDDLDRPFVTELQQDYHQPRLTIQPYADLSLLKLWDLSARTRHQLGMNMKMPLGPGEFMSQLRYQFRLSLLSWAHWSIGTVLSAHYMTTDRYDFLRPEIWEGFSGGFYNRFEFGKRIGHAGHRIFFVEYIVDHMLREGRYGEPVRMMAGFAIPLGEQPWIEDWKRR